MRGGGPAEAERPPPPHRLGHDAERHLARPRGAVTEDDGHLADTSTHPQGAVGELDLEDVSLAVHRVEVGMLDHAPAEALEPAREIADRDAEQRARVER